MVGIYQKLLRRLILVVRRFIVGWGFTKVIKSKA
jgi:hypothetical protein